MTRWFNLILYYKRLSMEFSLIIIYYNGILMVINKLLERVIMRKLI